MKEGLLVFKEASHEEEIKAIYDYNIDAFIDSPDFKWTFEEIKREIKEGWQLHGVYLQDEVIAAIFLKEEKGTLLSKNTAIKMHYQGSGFSHRIKEYIENMAKKKKLKSVKHYCRIDNFRVYSLNEGHGYKKSTRPVDDDQIVEWVKAV